MDDDETVLSAYVFIETVAAIVIQTAMRQFLAVFHADSLRQTRDAIEVAQRVLSIEESCLEESMLSSSKANSSFESKNEFSYESLLDDDMDNVALDLYELAAIQIQSLYRGFWVRDCLDVDHYCATVLQRMYRGLSCRKKYANNLRRIILVQSWCRRNIARDEAANILVFVIVIQSAFRGYRKRKLYYWYREKTSRIKGAAATTIQSRWRAFVGEAHFIRTLVDVLIVQTVVRRWLAKRKMTFAQRERRHRAEQMLSCDVSVSAKSQIDCFQHLPLIVEDRAEYENAPCDLKSKDKDSDQLNELTALENEASDTKHMKKYPVTDPQRVLIRNPNSFSGIVVNHKNMEGTILSDAKWTTAAARCINSETKKIYMKSKVVAYPQFDVEESNGTESFNNVRHTGPNSDSSRESNKCERSDQMSNVECGQKVEPTNRFEPHDVVPVHDSDIPIPNTTSSLVSIWKEKERRNGYPHRKTMV
jgi:IQ calmodulin-binding motif